MSLMSMNRSLLLAPSTTVRRRTHGLANAGHKVLPVVANMFAIPLGIMLGADVSFLFRLPFVRLKKGVDDDGSIYSQVRYMTSLLAERTLTTSA